MGNENAKRAKEQPLLSEPWRKIQWTNNISNLKFVRSYKPQTEGQQIRILLHGPNGAGKSSFINSVGSTLLRRMYIQALVDNVGGHSFTKQYTTYKIQKEKEDPGTFYPFAFNDIMGLDAKHGVKVEDVELALKGHIKDDYLFNPLSKISKDDPFYKQSPDFNDKVHVLVLVINADTVSILPSDMVKKIKEVREKATALGIPQLAIITKIDQVCPEVQKDLKNIYKIQSAKEKMENLSVETGIPMNCIFPVKNYHEEINLDDETDTLILSALAQIITSGEDHIKFVKNKNPPPDKYA